MTDNPISYLWQSFLTLWDTMQDVINFMTQTVLEIEIDGELTNVTVLGVMIGATLTAYLAYTIVLYFIP